MKSKRAYIVLALSSVFFAFGQQTTSDNMLSSLTSRVGLVIVATGKSIKYVEPLVKSAEQYFLPEHDRKFFVFTDHKPTLILSPEYCWAPKWSDNFHCRMLIVQKSTDEMDAMRKQN